MATIHTQLERARGCGFRHKGLYLMAGKIWNACGMLPIPLEVCPCCNQGIKFTRGFSWIGKALIADSPCKNSPSKCMNCAPWSDQKVTKLGLLWTGEKFYNRPSDFIKEVELFGLSKRIHNVPKDLVLGKTWVMLAHRKAIPVYYDEEGKPLEEPKYKKGIFAAFVPDRIEYIIDGTETEEELDAMEKKGYKLIRVIKDTDDNQLDINAQLDDYEIYYYKDGDKNKLMEPVKAQSEKAAKQIFKEKMRFVKTRIMSIVKM